MPCANFDIGRINFLIRRLCHLICLAAFLVIMSRPAISQTGSYYNITSVESVYMQNAVRVKINTDGAISANASKWWDGNSGEYYYLDWQIVNKQLTSEWSPECYPKVDRIKLHLDNARPQMGSVAHVGKYPVSHVEFAITNEENGHFGLDVDICLNKPMRVRYFKLGNWETFDAYLWDHHDPAWFEVVTSSDQRSLIITVASERLPEVRERLNPDNVPDSQREIKVDFTDDLLDVHAKNIRLSELIKTVSITTGAQMLVDTSTERLVTAELSHIRLKEFAQRIADCYGLVLIESSERMVFSDMIAGSIPSYTSGKAERIPVKYMKPEKARDLLPGFLMEYTRIDGDRNSIEVFGSEAMVEKVKTDLAKIDRPTANVSVRAVLLESTSTRDLAHELSLHYADKGLGISSDAAAGNLLYSKIEGLPKEFSARLNALAAAQKVKIRADSSITVQSGETGETFAGVDKYIKFRRRVWDNTDVVDFVSAGVRLKVTPWTGGKAVTMLVTTEATDVDAVDPVNGLPIINSRIASGTLVVKPGETIMIGGLSQRQTYTITRKIPLLGDLPLLGKLFRKRVKQQVDSELTVLLTPTIEKQETQDLQASDKDELEKNG